MLVYLLSAKYLDDVSKVYKIYQEGEGVEVETVLMPCVLK
jgi:hypothetical protein